MPSRNPLPLSASQEAQVRDVYHARVRRLCDPEIKGMLPPSCTYLSVTNPTTLVLTYLSTAFAQCAMGRTFSVAFACRDHQQAMNGCMRRHATTAEHDAAREEWFALRTERVKAREKKARRAEEQERFHREWWGLPDKDEEQRERDRAKWAKPERIAGVSRAKKGGEGSGGGSADGR
jgi:COX assembly mitochondrial protein 1